MTPRTVEKIAADLVEGRTDVASWPVIRLVSEDTGEFIFEGRIPAAVAQKLMTPLDAAIIASGIRGRGAHVQQIEGRKEDLDCVGRFPIGSLCAEGLCDLDEQDIDDLVDTVRPLPRIRREPRLYECGYCENEFQEDGEARCPYCRSRDIGPAKR